MSTARTEEIVVTCLETAEARTLASNQGCNIYSEISKDMLDGFRYGRYLDGTRARLPLFQPIEMKEFLFGFMSPASADGTQRMKPVIVIECEKAFVVGGVMVSQAEFKKYVDSDPLDCVETHFRVKPTMDAETIMDSIVEFQKNRAFEPNRVMRSNRNLNKEASLSEEKAAPSSALLRLLSLFGRSQNTSPTNDENDKSCRKSMK